MATTATKKTYIDPTKDNTGYMIGIGFIHAVIVALILTLFGVLEHKIADVFAWWFYVIIGVTATAFWLNYDFVPKKLNHARLFLINGSRKIPGVSEGWDENEYAGEGNLFKLSFGILEIISFAEVKILRSTYEIGKDPFAQQLGALEKVATADATEGRNNAKLGVFLANIYVTFNASAVNWNILNNSEEEAVNQAKVTLVGLIRDVVTFLEDYNDPDHDKRTVKSGFKVVDSRQLIEQLVLKDLGIGGEDSLPIEQSKAQRDIWDTGLGVHTITIRKIVADESITKASEEVAEAELQGNAQQTLAENFSQMAGKIVRGLQPRQTRRKKTPEKVEAPATTTGTSDGKAAVPTLQETKPLVGQITDIVRELAGMWMAFKLSERAIYDDSGGEKKDKKP